MIHPHELATLEALVTNTPTCHAFCPPLQRALLERVVKVLKAKQETQPAEAEAEEVQSCKG